MLIRVASNNTEWELVTLPIRLGGLGLPCLSRMSQREFDISVSVTTPLTALVLEQKFSIGSAPELQQQLKAAALRQKTTNLQAFANSVVEHLPAEGQRAVQLVCEKGSSSWLNALPLVEHGFDLSNSAFRDAVSLRYGWDIKNLPSTCACGANFNPAHAFQCPTGGFTITSHNEVRDLLAESLHQVSTNVSVEPTLLPLTGEHLRLRNATTDSDARLDIAASGFYGGRFEQALFDVWVFSPFASSKHGSLPAVYRRQGQEKRRKYGQRVREVEHASFVPLIFSCTGCLTF